MRGRHPNPQEPARHNNTTTPTPTRATLIGLTLILTLSACDTSRANPPTTTRTTLTLEQDGGDLLLPLWVQVSHRSNSSTITIYGANHQPAHTSGPFPERATAPTATPDHSSPTTIALTTPTEPRAIIVRYHDHPTTSSLTTSAAFQRQYGTTLLTRIDTNTDVVRLPDNVTLTHALTVLELDPRVARVEPDYFMQPAYASGILPNDPATIHQWGLFHSGAPSAWPNARGDGIVVAVIDTGFDLYHPDMAGVYLPGMDFCVSEDPATGLCQGVDDDPHSDVRIVADHGTHVASIIANASGNALFTTSLAPGARILPLKVFTEAGTPDNPTRAGGSYSAIINAMRWAAGLNVPGVPTNPNPARVINISLGGAHASQFIQDTINEVRAHGVTITASAGNHDPDDPSAERNVLTPASAAGVIAVGALGQGTWNADLPYQTATERDTRAPFSNYGASSPYGPTGLSIMAPGAAILALTPNNTAETWQGTSMASPHVAAAAAILLSRTPTLTPEHIETALTTSTYYNPTTMTPDQYGAGNLRIDALLGLPAPRTPTDRTATITLTTPTGTHTTTLDLLTGTSNPITLPHTTHDPTPIELTWHNHTYRATLHHP